MVIVAALLVVQGADAQKSRGGKGRKAKTTVVEPTAEDILYEELLPSTAKVTVIDSIVTPRQDMLNYISAGSESGLVTTYNGYFRTDNQPDAYVYVNEFGNRRYYTETDTSGHSRLYTADKLGGRWREPRRVTDFDGVLDDIRSPYMMADGVTLYFAARGEGSLGGYDIFVTRYDPEGARFYKPENIGLPYNSRGNEYMYVVDEFNEIGWLVSDREQPQDTVCVYIFVPSTARQTYDGDNLDDKTLRLRARLSSISDTWTDDETRVEALQRVARLNDARNAAERKKDDIAFVVNDRVTYHSANSFRRAESRERYDKLVSLKKLLEDKEATLAMMRDKYSAADASSRIYMKSDILEAENTVYTLRREIHEEEKAIRNIENTVE